MNVKTINKLRSNIASRDWEDLFLRGGCYHFAKALNGIYKLPYRKGEKFGIHVWCITPDAAAVDFNGLSSEYTAFNLALPGAAIIPGRPSVTDLSKEEVEDQLKTLPPSLSEEMLQIAESIIKSEERFRSLSWTPKQGLTRHYW